MPSKRYAQMRSEVARLGRAFLPRHKKGGVLDLTPRLSLRALAYRVLSHAEIEHFLEDRVAEIALAADQAWKAKRYVSETTLCLLAFSQLSLNKLPSTIKPPANKKQKDWMAFIKPDERVSASVTTYIRRVRQDNHGIKEENVLALLLPIGFNTDHIDELLLAELNDFGSKRGTAAHVSVSRHVSVGVNPFDEAAQVKRILDGLKAVDAKLNLILERCI